MNTTAAFTNPKAGNSRIDLWSCVFPKSSNNHRINRNNACFLKTTNTRIGYFVHQVVADYDKRADVENLVGEAKREGLDMIPSAKFKNNYAFFQIVMLAYNIWRYMKMIAQKSVSGNRTAKGVVLKGIMTNTARIARLKLLFIAAKVVNHSNRGDALVEISRHRPYQSATLA